MSGSLCYSSALTSPYKIITIQHSQNPNPSPNPSPSPSASAIPSPTNCSIIRRTISADMSSPKWLLHQSMNRAQSTDDLSGLIIKGDHSCNEEDEEEEEEIKRGAFEDIWSSIQAKKHSWSSILSHDGPRSGSGSAQLPLPYIHPLVKRSTSSLSEKSLEICTESLGSETGSDRFSYPPSDPEDNVEEEEEEEENDVISPSSNKYYPPSPSPSPSPGPGPSPSLGRRSRSFPPPLSSLAHRDGSNLHMRSHRQHGRLVLEAVSVPSLTCFRAHRHEGRLLLTLADAGVGDDDSDDEEEEGEENKVVEESGEEEMIEVVGEKTGRIDPVSPNGLMVDVDRSFSSLIMRKIIELTRTRNNSTWPRTINATVVGTLDNSSREKLLEKKKIPMVQLMSTTTIANATTLNSYEYYWRQSTSIAVLKPIVEPGQQIAGTKKTFQRSAAPTPLPQVAKEKEINKLVLGHKGKSMSLAQHGVVLVKAEGVGVTGEKGTDDEYLIPLLRGCKETRKTSLLFLEPYCIATS